MRRKLGKCESELSKIKRSTPPTKGHLRIPISPSTAQASSFLVSSSSPSLRLEFLSLHTTSNGGNPQAQALRRRHDRRCDDLFLCGEGGRRRSSCPQPHFRCHLVICRGRSRCFLGSARLWASLLLSNVEEEACNVCMIVLWAVDHHLPCIFEGIIHFLFGNKRIIFLISLSNYFLVF
ncbi:hypothetical protein Cni_G13715 [Canna indica]|uniref:Uncharacterized protein n=1 Tax=Canna indica TaxID=4628 RepID=A0AAQ3KAQ9_9LILI|nr:hypothetical protein Cni_G13715 [Canna indica]